jgi:hypothetical protein
VTVADKTRFVVVKNAAKMLQPPACCHLNGRFENYWEESRVALFRFYSWYPCERMFVYSTLASRLGLKLRMKT